MKIFLLPETEVTTNGQSDAVHVPALKLEVTLGIAHVVEQESLDVELYGSADGTTWTAKPVAAFPQKFYSGMSAILVDLDPTPGIEYLQVRWKVNRWGRGDLTPRFLFFVAAEPAEV